MAQFVMPIKPPSNVQQVLFRTETDEERIALAERMEEEGRSPDEIWRTLKVFRGRDALWKFEISDAEAELIEPEWGFIPGRKMPLSQILKHEELYNFMPKMRDTEIRMYDENDDTLGFIEFHVPGVINLNVGALRRIFPEDQFPERLREVLLHETQHLLQLEDELISPSVGFYDYLGETPYEQRWHEQEAEDVVLREDFRKRIGEEVSTVPPHFASIARFDEEGNIVYERQTEMPKYYLKVKEPISPDEYIRRHLENQRQQQQLKPSSSEAEQRGFIVPLVIPAGSSEVQLGLPRIIKDPLDAAVRLFSGASQYTPGDRSPENIQYIQDAADVAGSIGLSSLPIRRPANSLGTFGGQVAAQKLEPTVPAISRAMRLMDEMLEAGADATEASDIANRIIARDPVASELFGGVSIGKDGLPRIEINDQKMKFKQSLEFTEEYARTTLGELVDFPALFVTYPEIKNLQVMTRYGEKPQGAFIPRIPSFDISEKIYVEAPNEEGLKSTLLHEIQHMIQKIEGFTPGGNPYSPKTRPFAEEVKREDPGAFFPSWQAYRRLAGEVESRNVQARRNYSAEQRRSEHPETSEDVPRFQQFIMPVK